LRALKEGLALARKGKIPLKRLAFILGAKKEKGYYSNKKGIMIIGIKKKLY
jgi:hypothetical protein